MTEKEINDALALCDAATPGPWLWLSGERTGYMDSDGDYLVAGAEFVDDDEPGSIGGYMDTEDATFLFTAVQEGCSPEDAKFIAAAREGWPKALQALQETLLLLDSANHRHTETIERLKLYLKDRDICMKARDEARARIAELEKEKSDAD